MRTRMFRKLYDTAAGAFDDAVGVIVDGLLAPVRHEELAKARADLQALRELQWQSAETIERLSFDYKLAREELNKPVMSAWRMLPRTPGCWARHQTSATPITGFALAFDNGDWRVRVEPQLAWSVVYATQLPASSTSVAMCGGRAPDLDGAKAAVDIVLQHGHRLIGGAHLGPTWISQWRETATRTIRHLHGYGRMASVDGSGWEVLGIGRGIIAQGPETGLLGRHLADCILASEHVLEGGITPDPTVVVVDSV